jgi:hypothetical protein
MALIYRDWRDPPWLTASGGRDIRIHEGCSSGTSVASEAVPAMTNSHNLYRGLPRINGMRRANEIFMTRQLMAGAETLSGRFVWPSASRSVA